MASLRVCAIVRLLTSRISDLQTPTGHSQREFISGPMWVMVGYFSGSITDLPQLGGKLSCAKLIKSSANAKASTGNIPLYALVVAR